MNGNAFRKWLSGETDLMEHILDTSEEHDRPRGEIKLRDAALRRSLSRRPEVKAAVAAQQRSFYRVYAAVAVISCITLIAALLLLVAHLPRYGEENPRAAAVAKRYIEQGLEETGAVNVVSGMILDYRAFDTLGESHVLFTALVCVLVLLRVDEKNMRIGYEDYYTIRMDRYYDTSTDRIIRSIGAVLLPCILVFGAYILLNGQNSPGGGFSGGVVLGSAMMIFSTAYGFDAADRFLTLRNISVITFLSLTFYSFAKGYVFFTGANGIENHIPKGVPGAIFSGGLILFLDIAVGLVVACTMYGFFSLFVRGRIGSDRDSAQ